MDWAITPYSGILGHAARNIDSCSIAHTEGRNCAPMTALTPESMGFSPENCGTWKQWIREVTPNSRLVLRRTPKGKWILLWASPEASKNSEWHQEEQTFYSLAKAKIKIAELLLVGKFY